MKKRWIAALVAALAATIWLFHQSTTMPFAATAEALFQRQLLNTGGRDELLRRMQRNELQFEQTDPLQQTTQQHFGTNEAAILHFCAEAFQAEFAYRLLPDADECRRAELSLSDLYIAGQALAPADSEATARHQTYLDQQAQELARFGGDTLAWQRWQQEQLPARRKIEAAIAAEDTDPQTGWTIYPPLSSLKREHWISEQRSVTGKTRTRTADDLLALHLVDETVHQQLRQQLQQGKLHNELQVCQAAARLMQRRITYAQDLAAQATWLDQLVQAGLLAPAQRQQLQRDTQPYELKTPFEVLGYCRHGRVLALQQLPQAPQELYPALFAQAKSLLPDFHYSHLQATLTERPVGPGQWRQEVTISFRADGRQYENTFDQGYRRQHKPAAETQVASQFHQSINQWLADQHSPRRLYLAHTPDAHSVYGNERLGLLVQTAQQRLLWGTKHPLWGTNGCSFSSESHDNRFNSSSIERLLSQWQALGLFAHLSAAERAQGRRAALQGHKTRAADVLLSYPRVIHAFDWESANPPYPYAGHTRALAAIGHGAFTPRAIHDGFGTDFPQTPTVPFSFQLNGRSYHTQLTVQSDWLDSRFVGLINRALHEQKSPGRFYACLDEEGYIFLTPAQHAALLQQQPELFRTPSEESEELAF
jgi:hypothetical protein